MRRSFSPAENRRDFSFLLLAAFLGFTALTGGGSRPDILSLVILRPVAVVVAALAAWRLGVGSIRRFPLLFGMMSATIVLTVLHLIPLPPGIWQALPGRKLVSMIDQAVGLRMPWRPLSLDPDGTRNALFSYVVPLAVLLAGARLPRSGRERLLVILIVIGLLSGVLGLLQLLGSPTGPLFFYEHTNYGAATGLFANRNHQAIFLATLFPMMAALVAMQVDQQRAVRVRYGALAAGFVLVPMLLVTGSRAGIGLGALGMLSALLLLRRHDGKRPKANVARSRYFRWLGPRGHILLAIFGTVALVALTVAMSRALSISRLLQVGSEDELRFKVWPVIFSDISTYFPVGSGIGSFATAFKIVEPNSILRPTFLNHAHNETLEILLTAGLPGMLLLVAAIVGWAIAAKRAFARSLAEPGIIFARLGVVMIALLGLGSVADYPLRTPFLAAVLVIAALWCSGRMDESAKRSN